MAVLPGRLTTESASSNRLPEHIITPERMNFLDPDVTPLLTLTSSIQGRRAKAGMPNTLPDIVARWDEDDDLAHSTLINDAGIAVADAMLGVVDITVDSADAFRYGDVLRNFRTGEIMKVVEIDAVTDIISVIRGYTDLDVTEANSTAAAILNDNDPLVRVGVAIPEGSGQQPTRQRTRDRVYNYMQIWRRDTSMTDTQATVVMKTLGNDRKFRRKQAWREWKLMIERSILWGERALVPDPGEGTIRQMGGIDQFIVTNRTGMGGATTELALNTALEPMFRYGSGGKYSTRKFGIISPSCLAVLTSASTAKLQVNQKLSQQYGVTITDWVTANGILHLVRHPLFTGYAGGGVTYGYHASILVLDMEFISFPYLSGNGISWDYKMRQDIQNKDTHEKVDEFVTQRTLVLQHEEAHGLIYNFTGWS